MAEGYPRNVEFQTIREGWNRYQLDDGIVIRNRTTLKRITILSRENNQSQYSFDFGLETETDEPPRSSQTQSQSGIVAINVEPVQLKIPDDLAEESKFKQLTKVTQIYELEDGTIFRLAERVNHIWKTKKKDSLGRRIYHLDVATQLNGFVPPPIPP